MLGIVRRPDPPQTSSLAWLPKLSVGSVSVVLMSEQAEKMSNLLMVSGVVALCADCGDERLLVPADDGPTGAYCCTSCDAAVFLVSMVGPARRSAISRVA